MGWSGMECQGLQRFQRSLLRCQQVSFQSSNAFAVNTACFSNDIRLRFCRVLKAKTLSATYRSTDLSSFMPLTAPIVIRAVSCACIYRQTRFCELGDQTFRHGVSAFGEWLQPDGKECVS